VAEVQRRGSGVPERASALLAGRSGQVWFLGETIQGFAPAQQFKDRPDFSSPDVTAAFEDVRGHLWAAVSGRGLVEWIVDSNWERWFPEDLGKQSPSQVVRTSKGDVVAATTDGLFRLNPIPRAWNRLPAAIPGIMSLAPQWRMSALQYSHLMDASGSGCRIRQIPTTTGRFSVTAGVVFGWGMRADCIELRERLVRAACKGPPCPWRREC
jgi:hypothetical protein